MRKPCRRTTQKQINNLNSDQEDSQHFCLDKLKPEKTTRLNLFEIKMFPNSLRKIDYQEDDDKMEDGEHLITMMPKDGHDDEEARRMYEELGLVFVSYESGMGELLN